MHNPINIPKVYKSSIILRNWDFAVFCIYNSHFEKKVLINTFMLSLNNLNKFSNDFN